MALLADQSADVNSNLTSGTGSESAVYTVPGNVPVKVESVVATITNGAATAVTPELTIRDQSGVVIARKAQRSTIPAGDSGTATFALRLDDDAAPAVSVPTFPEAIATLALTNDLLGYWRFGDGASPFADTSGHPFGPADAVDTGGGAALTLHVTPGALAADDDGAVGFNGPGFGTTAHWLDAPDPIFGGLHRFNLANESFSLAGWVNPQASASVFDGSIIAQWLDTGSGFFGWLLGVNWPARTPFFTRRANGGAPTTVTGSALAADVWTFVVATYDTAAGHKLYVNGALVGSDAATFSTAASFNQGPNFGFAATTIAKAGVDEATIWGDALTLAEIATLYEAGTTA